MEDLYRPPSIYDNLAELAAQQKQMNEPRKPAPTAESFEQAFNNIRFQFDDLQHAPTTPLLISAPPPKPRRAIITPPRFSLDERLNSLRPVTYPIQQENGDLPNGNTQIQNESTENKKPPINEPQTANSRLHNDITNTISNLKPVHSEAKSSFFGLNGTMNKSGRDLSSDLSANSSFGDNKPLLLETRKPVLKSQPVVMRRLRDNMPGANVVTAKKPSPRFSRDSLDPEEVVTSDEHDSSNRNSKANSSTSSSTSTDRTVTPNTTLLSLLVADSAKKAVVSNEDEGNSSPKNARFQLPEGGTSPNGTGNRNSMGEKRLSQLDPNQTPVYMSTTVPQNIKGSNIMGRHKPTRTSLRHSRMIVINKNFQSEHKNSLNIKCGVLAKIFLIFQIIIGVALVAMGLYLLVWAPQTRLRDNPYWSGIMLVLSGILGLYLMGYKRTPLHRLKENFFTFVKINAAVILCCTIFFTMLAFIYASIHYHSLSVDDKKCVPENVSQSGSSCICVFHNSHLRFTESNSDRNITSLLAKPISPASDTLDADGVEIHYRDMSCDEVLGVWVYILLVSTLLNLLGLIFSVAYMLQFALGCRKRPPHKYLSVPMRQSAV